MPRTDLWNDSASRVALDHRSREAHLQLGRFERQFVPPATMTDSWLRRLLCPFLASASTVAAAGCDYFSKGAGRVPVRAPNGRNTCP